jgi:hypothetical protein
MENTEISNRIPPSVPLGSLKLDKQFLRDAPWLDMFQALGGAQPAALWRENPREVVPYGEREEWKDIASRGVSYNPGKGNAHLRAPFYMLMAFSHWNRALRYLENWPKATRANNFPEGLSFREYLGYWLWSFAPDIDLGSEDMEEDINAISAITGAVPTQHRLMKKGSTDFDRPGHD